MASAALPAAVAKALANFSCAVRARFGGRVSEIVLFGSHARGDANEDSDVDVLVAIDGLSEAERIEVIDLAYGVDRALDDDWVGLSVLAYPSARAVQMREGGRRLFRDIDREGQSL